MWHRRRLACFVSSLELLLLSSPSLLLARALIPAPPANPLQTLWTWDWSSAWKIYAIKCKSQTSLPHRGTEFPPQHLRWLQLQLWQCSGENPVDAGSYSSTGRQKESKAKSRTTTLDSRRADFVLFTPLLERIPWDTVLDRRGVQGTWVIFKDLLQAQEFIHPNEQETKGSRMSAWINQGLLTKLKHKNKTYKRWKQGHSLGGI